jgi:hypothetical protein
LSSAEYLSACGSVWVRNLVSNIKEGTQTGGVREQDAEENIWTEESGNWKKMHNEELHNLYCSPNIIRMIKSRRMRWAGLVAGMGETRNAYRILVGKPEGKRPLDQDVCGWTVLK